MSVITQLCGLVGNLHVKVIQCSFNSHYPSHISAGFTFNVEVGFSFVRATVAGVLSDVGLLRLPDCQDALLAIGADGDVLGGSDLLPVLEPFDVGDCFAQLTNELHLVLFHSSVVLQLGGKVQVALCKETGRSDFRNQESCVWELS